MNNQYKYRLFSLVAMVLIGFSLAACGGSSVGSDTSNNGTPAMSNADLIKTAASKMKSAKSYHIDADVSSGGNDVKLGADVDVTNASLKINANISGQDVQVIEVGSNNYLSTDAGKSFIHNTDVDALAASTDGFKKTWNNFNPAEADKAAANIKDGSPLTESIKGISCKHMTASINDLPSLNDVSSGTSPDGSLDLWVAIDGSSFCQEKFVGQGKNADFKGSATWSNINQPVNITAPPAGN